VRDLVIWYSDRNLVAGNRVTGARYGTHLMHTAGNVIAGNLYAGDVVGIFTMYSSSVALVGNTVTGSLGAAGVGLGFKESDLVVVAGNRLVANTTGMYVDTTPHRRDGAAWIASNLVAANEVGFRFHGPQTGAVLEHNGFLGNVRAVAVDGGGDAAGSSFRSNAWSEYAGYDLDGDGSGDLPFVLRSATGALRDRRPDLAFFTGTPAAALLDVLATAFPMFAPKPLLTDPVPRASWGHA
jgi:nitrous oxidase accessory protein